MILLSAGHHPLAKGATYNEHNEHDEAVLWIDEIAGLIRVLFPVDVVPTGNVSAKVAWINSQPSATLACELHFNSDVSKRQKGSETLYCPGSPIGEAAAGIVQAALGGIFPPSRGVKQGWYQGDKKNGPIGYLKTTKCPALILEPEFIYNIGVIQERRHPACAAIAEALVLAAQNIIGRSE